MPHSFTYLVLLISTLFSWLLAGCAQQDFILPDGFSPLGPASITYETLTPDPDVEALISKKIGHPPGPFLLSEEDPAPEHLHIFYKRQPDLKSIGLTLLSGGLGPVEANYTYILHVKHYSGEDLLQEYHYLEQIQEDTYSTFDDIFNPLYDPKGRSEEIFTLLCDRLLTDIITRPSGQSP